MKDNLKYSDASLKQTSTVSLCSSKILGLYDRYVYIKPTRNSFLLSKQFYALLALHRNIRVSILSLRNENKGNNHSIVRNS